METSSSLSLSVRASTRNLLKLCLRLATFPNSSWYWTNIDLALTYVNANQLIISIHECFHLTLWSRKSRKISSNDIYKNCVCFSVFTCFFSIYFFLWLLFFFKYSVSAFIQSERWTFISGKLVMWPRTSQLAKHKCKKCLHDIFATHLCIDTPENHHMLA